MSAQLTEGRRQLAICNSCRYCEGYCAVFPALERRRRFDDADLLHLANLCHDCRACLNACMYAPPHEFGVDIPALLTAVRLETYDTYSRLPVVPTSRTSTRTRPAPRSRLLILPVVTALVVLVVIAATRGGGALVASHLRPASPYGVIPYRWLIVLAAVPFVAALGLALRAARRYASDTRRQPAGAAFTLDALWKASGYAATLRYLGGGGEGCYHDADRPSAARRHLHLLVSYGFTLCLISTIAAAIMQDLAGMPPPYSLCSVPVVTGLIGGTGLVVGSAGLLVLKRRARSAPASAEMQRRDLGLLAALIALGGTGLLATLTRTTPAYGVLFALHLATVLTCFVVAPTTKFTHFLYRYLAIAQDSAEQGRQIPS